MDREKILKDQYVEPRKYGSAGFSYLTLELRRHLQKLLEAKKPIKEIANALGISRGTIYHERMRMGSVKTPYDAEAAHRHCMEGRKIDARGRKEIPDTYRKNISKMYRLLMANVKAVPGGEAREALQQCLVLLEKMGADPNKMKRPVTQAEIDQILIYWKEGKTYSQMECLTGRSRGTINDIVERHKETLEKPIEEITYDNLRSKWLDYRD